MWLNTTVMLRIHGFLIAATALFAMMSLEVCSDEVIPHFRFNGKFLRNNSWLELSLLSSNNTLQCMTDVTRGVVSMGGVKSNSYVTVHNSNLNCCKMNCRE